MQVPYCSAQPIEGTSDRKDHVETSESGLGLRTSASLTRRTGRLLRHMPKPYLRTDNTGANRMRRCAWSVPLLPASVRCSECTLPSNRTSSARFLMIPPGSHGHGAAVFPATEGRGRRERRRARLECCRQSEAKEGTDPLTITIETNAGWLGRQINEKCQQRYGHGER